MTKKEFVSKWEIDSTSVYYYKKRFPEIIENDKINYAKLNKILEHRVQIREKVQSIMSDKKPKDIEWLFAGKYAKEQSHQFVYQLCNELEQILVRESNYQKYLKILDYFGVKYENISS